MDDPLHLVGLFDHDYRLAPEPAGQDRGLDVAPVLVAVADQQCLRVINQRQRDQQFRLAASLQAEMPALTAGHQLLHHVPLLVAFHREHALVAPCVAVVSNGPLERGMQALKPVLKDVVEADQQWQG